MCNDRNRRQLDELVHHRSIVRKRLWHGIWLPGRHVVFPCMAVVLAFLVVFVRRILKLRRTEQGDDARAELMSARRLERAKRCFTLRCFALRIVAHHAFRARSPSFSGVARALEIGNIFNVRIMLGSRKNALRSVNALHAAWRVALRCVA